MQEQHLYYLPLKEITILSKTLGGMQEVLDILLEAGIVGDLVLTCSL